jgi:hypothetical protein
MSQPANILEKRQRALEQRRNRLNQLESSINTLARKQRTRRLIELGGLVMKSHLDTWPSNTLFGAFLSLKDKEENQEQKAAWTFNGRIHFIADKKQKTPVTLTFPSFPGEDLRQALTVLGFTWNAPQQKWEGYGDVEELRNLLEPHGGVVREAEVPNQFSTFS